MHGYPIFPTPAPRAYLFDLVGNLTQRQNNTAGFTENFYYDNVYRLDHSSLNGAINLQMGYDAMGNITSKSDVAGGAAWAYHPTKKHAVTQAGNSSYTYTYDANGNATSRNGYGINWSTYNYPTLINGPGKSMTFTYDANRQRIAQVYNNGSTTETTQYIGKLLEKVTANGITDWRHYISGGGGVVAIMSRQSNGINTTRYILNDHQGSISKITDSAGASFVNENFSAFGARRDGSDWIGDCNCTDLQKMASVTRMGYTGQDMIGGESMGLIHMNGRVQDSITGRFLSADPYISEPGNTQGYNRYSYVNNNPMSFIDPSGFCGSMVEDMDGNLLQGNRLECIPRAVPPQLFQPFVGQPGGAPANLQDYIDALTNSGFRPGMNNDPCPSCEEFTITTTKTKPKTQVVVPTLDQLAIRTMIEWQLFVYNHSERGVTDCGAQGGLSVPSQLGGVGFNVACVHHDFCYMNFDSNKGGCDRALRREIIEAFDERDRPVLGHFVGDTYYLAVSLFGRSPFNTMQHHDTGIDFLNALLDKTAITGPSRQEFHYSQPGRP